MKFSPAALTPANSDARRDLYEFEYPVCKLVVAKTHCVLGQHYHKKKDELFLLISGECFATIALNAFPMARLEPLPVPACIPHTFALSPGSVLLCFCTAPYDPADDYRV